MPDSVSSIVAHLKAEVAKAIVGQDEVLEQVLIALFTALTTRSVIWWKLPTLSARECRRAALEALGANGSWTWTKSNVVVDRRSSIVRPIAVC